MIGKIKENLALVVTAITLMGSIGAGIQSLGAVLNTLNGIDERMNAIEYSFDELRSETMVSSDLATLYEKVNQLEQQASQLEYLSSQIGYYDSEINNLKQRLQDLEWKLDDSGFQDSQAYDVQKWEWQDLIKKVTTLENNQFESWELDGLRDRIAYLEALQHQH